VHAARHIGRILDAPEAIRYIADMGKESASVEPPPDGSTSVPASASDRAPDPSAVLQVSLAEFSKLRDEIIARSNTAWTLLGLSATISTAVAGFVLAEKADPLLLLLLPVLTPSLGLLFIDHAINIGNIGTYIDGVLKPIVRDVARENRLLSYEEWVDRAETRPVWRLLPFGIPLVVLFNAVPIGALVYTVQFVGATAAWMVWGLGALITAVHLGFWTAFLVPPLRRAVQGES